MRISSPSAWDVPRSSPRHWSDMNWPACGAQRAGVTAYDAAYLWVASHLGAPLLTLDRELAQAATRVGVPLVT